MKKSLFKHCIQIVLICVPGLFALLAEAQTSIPSFLSSNSVPPQPEAKSWVLMENETGWVLAANNENNKVDPASLTKLMTAYLTFDALESGRINARDKVFISEKAWKAPGSRMFLNVDTSATINELIKGLIIQSGNDAAIALAEQIGGSESGFANLMNDAATQLGMLNTHYTNSSGLPEEGHYTTAYDTALLSRAIIRAYPDLYALFAIREYTYNDITQPNRNSLLWRDDSYDGLKTGHTKAAGYCLAGSAVREGTRFIATVMGADSTKNRVRGVSALIEYGFSQYETATVFGASDSAQVVALYKGELPSAEIGSSQPISVVIPKGQRAAMQISYDLPDKLVAPLSVNDAVGQAHISFNGSAIGQVGMYPLQDYELGPIWVQLLDAVKIKLF
jgi:D-alanyl-D-alanine carboxypeptidase (penicillin-binding protein 5/6)